jgi:hypothetical protein
MWHGRLSSAQMERVASSHGVGLHGDAVHVGGADTSQRHPSAIELFRHRCARHQAEKVCGSATPQLTGWEDCFQRCSSEELALSAPLRWLLTVLSAPDSQYGAKSSLIAPGGRLYALDVLQDAFAALDGRWQSAADVQRDSWTGWR